MNESRKYEEDSCPILNPGCECRDKIDSFNLHIKGAPWDWPHKDWKFQKMQNDGLILGDYYKRSYPWFTKSTTITPKWRVSNIGKNPEAESILETKRQLKGLGFPSQFLINFLIFEFNNINFFFFKWMNKWLTKLCVLKFWYLIQFNIKFIFLTFEIPKYWPPSIQYRYRVCWEVTYILVLQFRGIITSILMINMLWYRLLFLKS